MALTFFWRCESGTFSGTDDYSAGDTTPTAAGAPDYATAAAKIGTNGLRIDATGERVTFDATSIWNRLTGSFGFWWQFPTSGPTTGQQIFFCRGTSSNDYIGIESVGNGANVGLRIRSSSPATSTTLSTSSAGMTAGNWYFIAARWDQPNNDRWIGVYNSSGTLLSSAEDLATAYNPPLDFSGAGNFRIGDLTGSVSNGYFDNVFVGDAYADAAEFVTFRDITSYTEYGAGTGVARIGTPSIIESGGTYTAETGSNRLLVFAVGAEGSTATACETSDLTFGTVKAQLIRQRDTTAGYAGISVYVIPEASIPSGAQTVTATFVGTPTNSWITCLTLGDCEQSIAVDGSTDAGDPSTSSQQSWTLATNNNGGLGLAFAALSAATVTNSLTLADGWTEVLDAIEGAASGYWMGEKALTGASTTAGITPSTGTAIAIVAVAFRPLGIASTIAPRAAAYYYN